MYNIYIKGFLILHWFHWADQQISDNKFQQKKVLLAYSIFRIIIVSS